MYVHTYERMFTFCHRSSDLIYYPILIELHTIIEYEIPQINSCFRVIGSRSSSEAIFFLKKLHKMFSLTISLPSSSLNVLGPSQGHSGI